MATYEDVINGLELFAKIEGRSKHGPSAEHDELWAGTVTPEELTQYQRDDLEAWGWDYDEEVGSWRRFV